LTPSERLLALENFGIKLGLENITRLCAALGNPERSFASLHVAGTNGKGSVTSMVHAALRAAGIAAARYTSPHLSSLTERFVVDDAPVGAALLDEVTTAVLDCADQLQAAGTLSVPPTFFEATTAIGFELFRRTGMSAAAIEVGLGGRFDATNVIAPIAGAITTIGLDHQQHLGATHAEIAFEKAGIIKPGMPVVAGELPEAALAVVRQVSAERGARLIEAASDTRVTSELVEGRARITIETPVATYGPVVLALRGEHQIGNAVVAVRLLEAAADGGLRVPRHAVEQGLATADWPARLELIPLTGGRQVLLDAAHNDDGARALADYLERWYPQRLPLVVGVMRDKDVDAILAALLPHATAVIATMAPTTRALPADELAARVRRQLTSSADRDAKRAGISVEVDPDPARAIARALELGPMICVAGSIFLAGAVRDGLRGAILR
jgi:dihydrofolate synthase/folylpolyglutamate synthase